MRLFYKPENLAKTKYLAIKDIQVSPMDELLQVTFTDNLNHGIYFSVYNFRKYKKILEKYGFNIRIRYDDEHEREKVKELKND